MKIFKKAKFLQKKSSGSALIMVMIMMVNAILIMSAATAISFRESQNSGMAKISAVALQGADSGMEWALEKYRPKQSLPGTTLKDAFQAYPGLLFLTKQGDSIGLGSEISYRFYFIGSDGKPMAETKTINDLYLIRSVASISSGGGTVVSRALEARVKE